MILKIAGPLLSKKILGQTQKDKDINWKGAPDIAKKENEWRRMNDMIIGASAGIPMAEGLSRGSWKSAIPAAIGGGIGSYAITKLIAGSQQKHIDRVIANKGGRYGAPSELRSNPKLLAQAQTFKRNNPHLF